MTPITCDPDLLKQWLDGSLDDGQATQLEAHLASCEPCRQSAEESILRSNDLLDPFASDVRSFLGQNDEIVSHELAWDRWLDATDDPEMLGRFAGYEVRGVVGAGGMGVVFKARDVSLDRYIAIKILRPEYSTHSAARSRFASEARAAAAVVNDNVIAIHGVSEYRGMPYLIMPFINGMSLQQRIEKHAPLAIEEILRIALQVSRGLGAAHDQGVVHRDVKPANILMPMSVDRVVLTDFGLARLIEDAGQTKSGSLAGTPQYMSPEQVRDQLLDGRSDLFSLGCVMYAMSCGHSPFRGNSPYSSIRKVTDEPHKPLRLLRSDIPSWLESIVDRLLQKDPADRFSDAHELADHLEECLAHFHQPQTCELPRIKIGDTQRIPKPRSPWKVAALAGGITAMLGCLVTFAFRTDLGVARPSQPEFSDSDLPTNANIAFPREILLPALSTETFELEQGFSRLESEVASLQEDLEMFPFNLIENKPTLSQSPNVDQQ
ncbi:MAG: protein kinase [Planctomycetota bacterium]